MELSEQEILARTRQATRPRHALRIASVVALSLVMGVAAFGISPDTTLDTVRIEKLSLDLPAPAIAVAEDADGAYWREERIQRGDTVGSVLARLGVDEPDVVAFVRGNAAARSLYQLRPGRPLRAAIADDGTLLQLRYLVSPTEELTISRSGADYVSRIAAPRNDARLSMQTAVIQSSLYGAADAAGLPDAITQQIAEIFAGDIDFYHDLRRGDRFSVVYEVLHVDGEPVKTGRVVAAEFVNAGRALRAFWFAERDGEGGYYSADGRSLRLAFLRSPLEFSRITSGFSLARMHPIFNTVTAHRGIDYGAPTGTPVRSTGEGKVAFAGQQGGYGNVVIVQHHGTYSTVYGHLSRFAQGLRTGSRVAQGEVIGYVGATGWATGPHLHYEFRVDNQARDPLRIALPQARPIPDDAQPRFLAGAAELSGRMELLRGLPVAIAR